MHFKSKVGWALPRCYRLAHVQHYKEYDYAQVNTSCAYTPVHAITTISEVDDIHHCRKPFSNYAWNPTTHISDIDQSEATVCELHACGAAMTAIFMLNNHSLAVGRGATLKKLLPYNGLVSIFFKLFSIIPLFLSLLSIITSIVAAIFPTILFQHWCAI